MKTLSTPHAHRDPLPRSERGSLILVALILSAVIAVSLTSYLNLSLTSTKLSYRSHYAGAAMNVAESGLEYAMWALNKQRDGDSSGWTGWTTSGLTARRTFTFDTLAGGATTEVKVFVSNRTLSTSNPYLIARGIVTPKSGPPIEKWVQVSLSKRSKFSSALVAKDRITFNGNNAMVDSWNSDPDKNEATAPIPYSSSVRNDNGSVGSISIENAAIDTRQADIWGYASTGGDDPTDDVGKNGSILGEDSASKDQSEWTNSNVDPDRVATDFTASFEEVETPDDGTTVASITSGPVTLGTAGTTTKLSMTSISLSGGVGQMLTIQGDVILVLTKTLGDALSITGNASISIPSGSSLTIYSSAGVKIAGNGVANSNIQPKSLFVYGTATDSDGLDSTTHQEIDIVGNGDLKAVVYAPNATVTVNGNGNVMGSVVAGKVTFTGNASFHYDESLAALDDDEPFGIDEWKELITQVDRNSTEAQVMYF